MALPVSTPVAATTATAPRPVSARHFARLKLRVMANGFRGQTAKVVLFVLGLIGGPVMMGVLRAVLKEENN